MNLQGQGNTGVNVQAEKRMHFNASNRKKHAAGNITMSGSLQIVFIFSHVIRDTTRMICYGCLLRVSQSFLLRVFKNIHHIACKTSLLAQKTTNIVIYQSRMKCVTKIVT